jgi:hypothetical protein
MQIVAFLELTAERRREQDPDRGFANAGDAHHDHQGRLCDGVRERR